MHVFGCFELRTECEKCGQPVPINGPMRSIQCSYCFESLTVTPDRFKSLIEDLVDEHGGLTDGQGRGGQLMSERTYHYGYWRLAPRCRECKRPLPVTDVIAGSTTEITCECGKRYPTFPAPDWLIAAVPTAVQCYCADAEPRPAPDGESTAVSVDDDGPEPVVMACPQCGGALSITVASDRVHHCQYCSSNVYIPDPLWRRLHPVKQVHEWFVAFEPIARGSGLEATETGDDPAVSGSLEVTGVDPDLDRTSDDGHRRPPWSPSGTPDTVDIVDDADDRTFLFIAFAVVAVGVAVVLGVLLV